LKVLKVGDFVYSLITNDTDVLYEVIEITNTSGTTKYNLLAVHQFRVNSLHQLERKIYLNISPNNIEKVTADKAFKAKITILFNEIL